MSIKLKLANIFFNCYMYFLDVSARTVATYPLNNKFIDIDQRIEELSSQSTLFCVIIGKNDFVKVIGVEKNSIYQTGISVKYLDFKNEVSVSDASLFYTLDELKDFLE